MAPTPHVAVVIVGAGGVGKSAITLSFVRDRFVEEYDPTIEDSYSKECEVDKKLVVIDITDTAGQEEYRGLWGDRHIRNGDGFICVYSITSRESLNQVTTFRDQILTAKDVTKCPMLIVGNKCDLVDLREVPEADGRELAVKSNAQFLETSAKTKVNIEETFATLVRIIRKSGIKKKPSEKKGKGGGCVML